ncbi:MAG TPA: BPL-N domain-containing protein, partial [Bdellovibrio sp.]|nr:BPL-N domain-containing protein [Bdellovibrio sp.]
YLAGVEIRDRKVIPGFALVDVGFEIENTSDDARVLDVNWDGREFRKVYYQAGPYFTESSRFESINVATYTKSNHSAAMIYKVGKGRVGVLGPHFEAFKDWYTDDDLEAPQALNHDLFGEFIERLFEAN